MTEPVRTGQPRRWYRGALYQYLSMPFQNVRRFGRWAGGIAAASAALGFFAVCLGYCAIILDGSVLNVALPTIRHDLGHSMAAAQWVLSGYTLALSALLLTAGALGDRIGLRRMLLGGVALFTVASAACASAQHRRARRRARRPGRRRGGAAAGHPGRDPASVHRVRGPARATVAWVAAA